MKSLMLLTDMLKGAGKSRVTALLTVLFLFTGPAYAEKFTADDTIVIGREITGSTMQPVLGKVLSIALDKKVLPNLNIIISSPGGSVHAGFMFISTLRDVKARGTKLTCYVVGVAASMAFHILTHCDKRVVLTDSFLLWHRARVMINEPITGPLADNIAKDLAAIDHIILSAVLTTVGKEMDEGEVVRHFEVETAHVGSNLCSQAPKFCTAVPHVQGLFAALLGKDIVHAEAPFNPFGKRLEMLYIWSQALTGTGGAQ